MRDSITRASVSGRISVPHRSSRSTTDKRASQHNSSHSGPTKGQSSSTSGQHHREDNSPDMLSSEEVEYYSEVFNMFDKDGSGAIDLQELAEAMESTGISPTESELRTMISGVAGNKEEVSLDQFLRMVSIIKAQNIKETQMDMREAFDAMDVDKNGYISASDLFKVLDNIGERLPADTIYEMLQFGDDDLDGKVGFQDFCKIMAGGAS